MSVSQKFSRIIRVNASEVRAKAEISALIQHEVVGILPDGRLPLPVANADLKVLITLDLAVELPTFYVLILNGLEVPLSKRDLAAGEDVPGQKIEVTLPLANLANDGEYSLDYVVYTTTGANPEIAHLPLKVIVDRTAPGGTHLGAIYFDLVDDFVNDAALTGGKLTGVVPDWFGMYTQDTATAWIAPGRDPATGDWVELPLVKHDVVVAGEEVQLVFDRADLAALPDGYQSFSYKLKDILGNSNSELAAAKVLRVLLSDVPSNILPPVIPAFDDDGLVTWNDARTGVRVQIPVYTNPDPSDQFVIRWGGTEAPLSSPLGTLPNPLPTPPAPITTVIVDYDIVKLIPKGALDVTYRILRGGIQVGFSLETTIEVDLTTPGGIVDPQPETPEHENLQNAVVRSASGQVDVIPPADYLLNGTVTIPRAGKDGTAVWINGDTVEVSWGPTLKLPAHPINNQNTDLVLPLNSATIIQPGPNGPVNVSYTISRDLVPAPNVGVALSAVTVVQVTAAGDVPGGGQPLVLARFPEANADNIINKALGQDGTPVRILLPIDNMDVGDTLAIDFTGVFSRIDETGLPIPGTQVTDNHTLVRDDFTRGYYEFNISAAILIAICDYGAKVTYVATNQIDSVPSGVTFVKIAVRTPGYCTVPVPTP